MEQQEETKSPQSIEICSLVSRTFRVLAISKIQILFLLYIYQINYKCQAQLIIIY